MPNYSFKNKDGTGEVFDKFLKMADREVFLQDNPHIKQVITSGTPMVDSIRMGRQKPDQGFRDILSSMKQNKSYTGNKINDWK
jgi:hypothetical protein|tara:strand:- start:678 stop:926 length:249 start_codon:yes stop_codon:yes gene_type:complete